MSTKFCGNSDITKIFIVQSTSDYFTGGTVSGNLSVNGNIFNCGTGSTIYTDNIESCNTGITINNIVSIYGDEIIPTSDDLIYLGTSFKRFREVNTVSGTSTVWTSTGVVHTPNLNLGLDLSGNTRIITAENSIIQDDILNGGVY